MPLAGYPVTNYCTFDVEWFLAVQAIRIWREGDVASRGDVAPETEVSVTLSHHWHQWHILFDSPASVSIFHFYEVSATKCVRAILEESNSKCHFRINVTRVIWHICRWMPRPPATTSSTTQQVKIRLLSLFSSTKFFNKTLIVSTQHRDALLSSCRQDGIGSSCPTPRDPWCEGCEQFQGWWHQGQLRECW